MNILDKMQLLKLLREYKIEAMALPPAECREISESVEKVTGSVENKIRNWLNSGGGF